MTYIDTEAMVKLDSVYQNEEIRLPSCCNLKEVKKEIDKMIKKYGEEAMFRAYSDDDGEVTLDVTHTSPETDKEFAERKEKSIVFNDAQKARKLRIYQDLKKEFGE